MAEPFRVDAVTDAGRHVPFDRDAERRQALRRLEQGLRRNEIVCSPCTNSTGGRDLMSSMKVSGLPSGGSTNSPE